MPPCRIDPPSRCFQRHASPMNSRDPASTAPSGAANPLVKSSHTVSQPSVISLAFTPSATAAFSSRAPSMCVAIPCRCAASVTSRSPATLQHAPPPRLAVCSTSSSVCGGLLRLRGRIAASTASAVNWPRSPGSPLIDTPAIAPGAPASLVMMCAELVRQDLVARPAMRGDRHLVAHRPRRQEHRRLLAQQRRDPIAQRPHAGIGPGLLIADLRIQHRLLHPARRLGLRVGIQVDPDRNGKIETLRFIAHTDLLRA